MNIHTNHPALQLLLFKLIILPASWYGGGGPATYGGPAAYGGPWYGAVGMGCPPYPGAPLYPNWGGFVGWYGGYWLPWTTGCWGYCVDTTVVVVVAPITAVEQIKGKTTWIIDSWRTRHIKYRSVTTSLEPFCPNYYKYGSQSQL